MPLEAASLESDLTPTPGALEQAPEIGRAQVPGALENKPTAESASREASLQRDRDALAALDDGVSVEDYRKGKNQDAGPSGAGNKAAKAGEGESKANGDAAPPPQAHAAAANSAATRDPAFAGLGDSSYQALSQTRLLPDAESWAQMPALTRANMVKAAKTILAERTRNFQASQALQQRGGQQQAAADFDDPEVVTPLEDKQEPAAGTRTVAQGGSPKPTPAPARAPAAAPAKPADAPVVDEFDTALSELEESLDEDTAARLRKTLTGLKAATTAQLESMKTELANRPVDPAVQYMLKQHIAGEERNARSQLDELAGSKVTDDQWKEIVANGRVFAQAAFSSQRDFTWEQSLVMAGRALLSPQFHQNAQRALAQNRSKSLKGTPERGTEVARPNRGGDVDRDAVALELLDQGRTADDVKQELF